MISSPGFKQAKKEKSTASDPPAVIMMSSAVKWMLYFS